MSKPTLIFIALLLIVPFILIAIFWGQIPDVIPIHYDLQGVPNDFANKMPGIFFVPVINAFVFLLLFYAPKLDPKKQVLLEHSGYVSLILITISFMFSLFTLEFLKHIGYNIFGNYFLILIPLLFVFLGNYITKVKPNYFVGIRTPWTLQNETVWTKTHRFGGRLWVFSSLVMVIAGFAFNSNFPYWLGVVYIVAITLIPIVYSYMVYKQLPNIENQ